MRARRHDDRVTPSWLQIAGTSIVALNLIAVLACVRELDAVWRYNAGNPEAELQRSLAVSAFFDGSMEGDCWRLDSGSARRLFAGRRWCCWSLRSARLFCMTLVNLSQGYRVLSFLGLGALLMAVSFAYQKDWLALREPARTVRDAQEGVDR